MKVYLVNPDNPVVSLSKIGVFNKLNKLRVWKPLSLFTLASLTPPGWDVEILDENLGPVDYDGLPRPDAVGITAFTSQAPRAYQIAAYFREQGVPVVMGGIHASMCVEEASQHVDAVVTGEAESQWARVLEDIQRGTLAPLYKGELAPVEDIPPGRADLLPSSYFLGSIQTTRGCPLRCTFCSVTAFNGGLFRLRPIENVIEDLRRIEEPIILVVDDNLVGTRQDHIERSKELFRAMIREGLTKPWICQATINMADDDELLALARKAGCVGVFIGFEAVTEEGLIEVHKKFNLRKGRNFRASVRRIQKHGIVVTGSFIMGLDTDPKGIGGLIAQAAEAYGVDAANVLILTPLPGTALWDEMERAGRILANDFPADWKYYTLAHPVARYKNFEWRELVEEMNHFHDVFYSPGRMARRTLVALGRHWRRPASAVVVALANLSYRSNHRLDRHIYRRRTETPRLSAPTASIIGLGEGAA